MSIQNLYQPVWDKFLPVILLKLKSALRKQESEFLVMDKLDFERASHRKNSSYIFRLELNEGRILRSKDTSSVGIDFARAIKGNEILFNLIKEGSIVFSMNNKFVLSIVPKFNAPVVLAETQEEVPQELSGEKATGPAD